MHEIILSGESQMGTVIEPDGTEIPVACETGDISDGYHTFNELYDHRIALFIALMRSHNHLAWKSMEHNDGTMHDGWFIVGMNLPTGQVTYHLPVSYWGKLNDITNLHRAPAWDEHTPEDVIHRITEWLEK